MAATDMLEIVTPDDWHHHCRDGAVLRDVITHAARSFSRAIIMPNIKPPVRTVEDARAYRERILSCLPDPSGSSRPFEPLMTLYLTDFTTPEEIRLAKASGFVHAAKLYPAGATTNSEFGVTSLDKLDAALTAMSEVGMPLLVHGEVTDPAVDVFDREKVFIDSVLKPLLLRHAQLKVVMEHITTKDAVDFVSSYDGGNIAATITAHHLLYNRNDLFKGGVCPHMFCLPILKRELHRQALVDAATSGNPKFFLGTDSAPHSISSKQSACGCAGIFTGHAPLELYAEAFDIAGKLDKLEGFASIFGPQFYGLPLNEGKVRLVKESWLVPEYYPFGGSQSACVDSSSSTGAVLSEGEKVRPLRAGEHIAWRVA